MDWETASAIGAGVVSALVALWKMYLKDVFRKRWKRSREDLVRKNATRYVHLYALAQRWRDRENAQQVLILYARNSGRPWDPQSPVKVSCLIQAVGGDNTDTSQEWQNWECDSWYRVLLERVMWAHTRTAGLAVETEPDVEGVLRAAYRDSRTIGSYLFQIATVPEEYGMVYVSVNFGSMGGHDDQDPAIYTRQLRELSRDKNRIRQMIMEGQTAWGG